ncbi:MAG: acyloxyacyl hydrolase [Zoogloeaceae bacterium]|jgi:opacity protein-like surface antigen|nr:acyloxyacyl hydrolase [Zoogloeaceae bacterium]
MRLFSRSALLGGLSALMIAAAPAANAFDLTPDGMAVEVGSAQTNLTVTRLSAQWDWNKSWFDSNGTSLSGYFDANIAWWNARDWHHEGDTQNLGVIGFTPVFRFMRTDKKGPYIEGGIGVALFSKVYNNDSNKTGTAFQFADHIGIGYVFDNNFDLGLRLQHYSNAGISSDNDGEELLMLRAAYRW